MDNKSVAVKMRNITKTFGSVVANDKVWLDIYRGEILALQQKVGFYQKNRVEQIRENWPEICQILREASDAQGQLELIRRTGLDPQAFLDFYGRDKILEAVRFARDLKDRYTALWLMNDVQAQEECVTEELLRF